MPDVPALTTRDLARLVHGTLEGDADRVIRDVATLDVAGPGDVAWLANDRLLDKFRATRAGVVLVPTDMSDVSGKTVIRVPDPDLALCTVLEALAPEVRRLPEAVHPDARVSVRAQVGGACIAANAQVGANSVIGEGTQVHPGVYIGDNCRIGRDCVIWPNVVIRERTTLGDRVVIHPNATIGADGFGYLQRGGRHVKIPQIGRVVIEDDVEIGAGSCIDRARSGVTRIGRGTKIDNLVQIAHNVQIGEGSMIVGQVGIGGSAKLGRYVVIGGQSGVVDHVMVGDRAVFAAQSLATSDVAPGEVVRGSPGVHYQQFARETVAVRRLPKLIEEVRKLRKRVEELESTANQ